MQRVLVVGQSSAGKSTAARLIGAHLCAPHVELDALFHGPDWTPRASFEADVDAATQGQSWVVDGNYSTVRELLWSRADTVVWLDLTRSITTRRAVVRTLRRFLTRAELWNGNRERARTVLRASHPIRWTWQTHTRHRAAYEDRLADPRWAHLHIVRLRTPAEVRGWFADMA